MISHDVIVVGGGAVGAALTLSLRQGGIDAALVERGAPPAPWRVEDYDLRVYALSPASSQFLARIGVWPSIIDARASAYQAMQIWDAQPQAALSFDATAAGLPALGHIVENSLLLQALWRALAAAPVYAQTRVTQMALQEEAAILQLRDGRVLQAPLVIAADGADSELRESAGIDCVRWRYPQRALVCHVQTEKPHRATAYQRFLPSGPLAFLPLSDGRSSIVWSSDHAQDLLELDDAAFNAQLAAAAQFELGAVTTTTPRVVFPLQLLHAKTYVQPRFALAGDAAHVVHPLAGQGVNLGLSDALALSDILIAAHNEQRDLGSLRLLKRYERARRADNLDMLAVTDGLNRAFAARGDVWDRTRNFGVTTVNRLGPLKQLLARRAAGL